MIKKDTQLWLDALLVYVYTLILQQRRMLDTVIVGQRIHNSGAVGMIRHSITISIIAKYQ